MKEANENTALLNNDKNKSCTATCLALPASVSGGVAAGIVESATRGVLSEGLRFLTGCAVGWGTGIACCAATLFAKSKYDQCQAEKEARVNSRQGIELNHNEGPSTISMQKN